MIKISREQKEILSNYFDVDKELKKDNIVEFLEIVDDIIIENIVSNNDEPDAEGIKLQKVYDQIYNQN